MQNRFDIIIVKTLKHEGGYVWRDDDPGGETNYGISKGSYPSIDIKNLTKAQAIEIYRRDYWEKPKINMIKDDDLAAKVFDIGVNVGTTRAVRFLQTAINFLGAKLATDGVLGPKTLSAVNGHSNPKAVLTVFKEQVRAHYLRQNKPQFITGWLRRLDS